MVLEGIESATARFSSTISPPKNARRLVWTMNAAIRMNDVVALGLDNAPARHFTSGQPLLLRRGQIGTVVIEFMMGRRMRWNSPGATDGPMPHAACAR